MIDVRNIFTAVPLLGFFQNRNATYVYHKLSIDPTTANTIDATPAIVKSKQSGTNHAAVRMLTRPVKAPEGSS